MILKIIQKPTNGFLGGPKYNKFTLCANGFSFNIEIQQSITRIICIDSSESNNYKDYLDIFYTLETLLMICDGHFMPTVSAFEDDIEITSSWNKRRLPSYSSADFMLGTWNKLIDYSEIIDEDMFMKWYGLKKELDLNFKMMLYCVSSVEMPKDIQCAFMTEAFLGIYELVIKKHLTVKMNKIPDGESKLKYYLIALFEKFGAVIFGKELTINKNSFAQILVNSRNRIAHISSRQDRVFLNGEECVMYLKKLSLLYRIIIFDHLEISEDLYKDKLSSATNPIDNHKSMSEFFDKLKNFS